MNYRISRQNEQNLNKEKDISVSTQHVAHGKGNGLSLDPFAAESIIPPSTGNFYSRIYLRIVYNRLNLWI